MVQCGDGDSAALYALGLLDESDSRAFEGHLSTCPSCEAALRESGELAVDLARTLPVAFPPASLRQRVLTQTTLPPGVAALARGEHLDWRPLLSLACPWPVSSRTPFVGNGHPSLESRRERTSLPTIMRPLNIAT